MDGKKRILFVVGAMGGGVFTYIVDLANGLAEKYSAIYEEALVRFGGVLLLSLFTTYSDVVYDYCCA